MSDTKRGRLLADILKQVKAVKDNQGKFEDSLNRDRRENKETREMVENLLDANILRALCEKKRSGKYMYSYQEIADEFRVSNARVQKVAELNGIRRLKDLG